MFYLVLCLLLLKPWVCLFVPVFAVLECSPWREFANGQALEEGPHVVHQAGPHVHDVTGFEAGFEEAGALRRDLVETLAEDVVDVVAGGVHRVHWLHCVHHARVHLF